MNLEEELNRTWDLWQSGVPVYMRGGKLEVDPPDMAPAPAQAAGQTATGADASKIDLAAGPFDSANAGKMLGGLVQGVKDIGNWFTKGGVDSVGGMVDDVHLYGSQRLNPVAAQKALIAPISIQALWREMTDGQEPQGGALSQALNLINSEGQQNGTLKPGERFAVRRNEQGFLEPIVADESMTDNALMAGGRLASSFYATDPLGGVAGTAAVAAKAASRGRSVNKGVKNAAVVSSGVGGEDGNIAAGVLGSGMDDKTNRTVVSGVVADVKKAASEWKANAPFETLDEVYRAAPGNQTGLARAADAIGLELGLEFKNPGIKGQPRAAEKLAQKGGPAGSLTDIVRGGFNLADPSQADAIVARLAKQFDIVDEGWVKTDAGYFDRKLLVRFPDGMVGEMQLWEPNLLKAKQEGGHDLYKEMRSTPANSERAQELRAEMKALYDAALAAAAPAWRGVLEGKAAEAASGKTALKSASDISPASAQRLAGPRTQEPSTNMNASRSDSLTGVPSQSANRNSDIRTSNDSLAGAPLPRKGNSATGTGVTPPVYDRRKTPNRSE